MSTQTVVSKFRVESSPSARYAGMGPATQIIMTDGGPWCHHNVACAVCGDRSAVMNLNLGVFEPCWSCQRNGWQLKHKKRRWWNARSH